MGRDGGESPQVPESHLYPIGVWQGFWGGGGMWLLNEVLNKERQLFVRGKCPSRENSGSKGPRAGSGLAK